MVQRWLLPLVALVAVFFAVANAQVPVYGQCGGEGYTGDTTCASGSTCVYSNPYYSQCLPGSSGSGGSTTTSTASGSSGTGTPLTLGSAGQVISGIGASGAWWPLDLYKFPASQQAQAAKLLFDSSASSSGGAGLTSYRYNLGGGGNGVGTADRAPGTFYVSSGSYNWNADPQGVYFLKQAASYGVPQITAFVNSAPPAFTSNGKACGGTLNTASISAFSKYIADVISYWKTQGVTFTHVSPMNEPDNSFGGSPCGQEGMIVTTSQRAPLVQALRSALNSAGLSSVQIMADESSTASQFISESPSWLSSAASSVGMVAHHMYGFDGSSTAAQLGSLGRSESGKQTWFTEICCFVASSSSNVNNPAAALTYGQRYDPTMVGALQLGQLIYQSFTTILDGHFDFWTALSPQLGCEPSSSSSCTTAANSNGWNDGLIYYDPQYASNGNTALYTTKRYFLFKHFARFVFMGSTRYGVSGVPSGVYPMAFKAASSSTTQLGTAKASLILMNMGTSTQTVNVGGLGLGTVLGSITTNAGSDWSQGGASSSVSLSSLSIVTVLYG